MILYPEMYIIVGYVQIFWHRLLGKQHNIECYKAKCMTIKIYFQKKITVQHLLYQPLWVSAFFCAKGRDLGSVFLFFLPSLCCHM